MVDKFKYLIMIEKKHWTDIVTEINIERREEKSDCQSHEKVMKITRWTSSAIWVIVHTISWFVPFLSSQEIYLQLRHASLLLFPSSFSVFCSFPQSFSQLGYKRYKNCIHGMALEVNVNNSFHFFSFYALLSWRLPFFPSSNSSKSFFIVFIIEKMKERTTRVESVFLFPVIKFSQLSSTRLLLALGMFSYCLITFSRKFVASAKIFKIQESLLSVLVLLQRFFTLHSSLPLLKIFKSTAKFL